MKAWVRKVLKSMEKEREEARKRGAEITQLKNQARLNAIEKRKKGLPLQTRTFDKPRFFTASTRP